MWRWLSLMLTVDWILPLLSSEQVLTPSQVQRDGRLLMTITPEACYRGEYEGICLPWTGCQPVGGRVDGKCFWDLGECCIFNKSCEGETEARVSYFTSSSPQANAQGSCIMRIIPSAGVCQLRLYLKEFNLPEPDATGDCVQQYLHVVSDATSEIICGANSGQHLYVEINDYTKPVKLFVVTVKAGLQSSWNIKIDQLHCSSSNLAPTGCLQNLRGITGDVKSFNYNPVVPSSATIDGKPGTRQLRMSYNICVRREPGYCAIRWTAAHGATHAFSITGIKPAITDGIALNNDCKNTDYLILLSANVTVGDQTEPGNVICGFKFPDQVESRSFQLGVVTNDEESENGDFDNRGFHLRYEQVRCP
ncbi:uncharacterized protein LOC135224958 [Macrobrachium nipponense]|uniref:uncharacterized protein LOC135224958 n=1 Tax=Macrobrachium nipponense TaxID=159736 RepID=UPI0030C7ADD9